MPLTYLHFINQSSLCHQVKQTKPHHAVVNVELTVSCQSSTIVYDKHPTLHRTTSNALQVTHMEYASINNVWDRSKVDIIAVYAGKSCTGYWQ